MMKRGWKRMLIPEVCLCLAVSAMGVVSGAGADDFRTEEYYNSTGLDIINAADAYALGYTGKGIILGICDDYVKLAHPEFLNKPDSSLVGEIPEEYDWVNYGHGSHVVGIMAANRDGKGMHGLAFDANFISGVFQNVGEGASLKSSYAAFVADERIKIINNSWGFSLYIDQKWRGNKTGLLEYLEKEFAEKEQDILSDAVVNHDKVLVLSAGNNGHNTPGILGALPYLYPETAGNIINVTCVDSRAYDQASQSADCHFNVLWSDLVKYAEENSIAAPGMFINSASAGDDGYMEESGTSMSAPYVSAAAGLVQQAFPYMNGRQITDTVLSSANATFALPEFTFSLQEDATEGGEIAWKFNLYYFGDRPDAEQIAEDLHLYYEKNGWALGAWYGITSEEKWNSALEETELVIYDNVPREMIFGQGLLDVGAAVQGPGLLNARRMDKSSYCELDGKGQALYRVDTKGFDSVWSNDIGEKRAGLLEEDSPYEDLRKIYGYYLQGDEVYAISLGQEYIDEYNGKVLSNGLKDLPVGLCKEGMGTLVLEGQNTYQGASVAVGGVLQIDGSVAGDAWSMGAGTIGGSGTVSGNLVNHGFVRAGSRDEPGVLTVEGGFKSDGVIEVAVRGEKYGRISVGGMAEVQGSRVMLVSDQPYRAETSYEFLTAEKISGTLTGGALTGMLSAVPRHDGRNAVLEVEFHNNMEGLQQGQTEVFHQMAAMYEHLEGRMEQRDMDRLFNLDAGSARQAITELYGGMSLNLSAVTQRNAMLSRAAEERISSRAGTPLCGNAPDSGWLQISRDWGSVDGSGGMPGYDSQSFGLVMGYDREVAGGWKAGLLAGGGTNKASGKGGRGENQDYRVGLYGGYLEGGLDVMAYAGGGYQNNDTTRYLSQLGLESRGSYDSYTLGTGARVAYNLLEKYSDRLQVRPYVSLNLTRYEQESCRERGAGVYSQQMDSFDNTYMECQAGMEVRRSLGWSVLAANAGYKRVMSGANPGMSLCYAGNPGSRQWIRGSEQGRDFLVLGISASADLGLGWGAGMKVENEVSDRSDNLSVSASVSYMW